MEKLLKAIAILFGSKNVDELRDQLERKAKHVKGTAREAYGQGRRHVQQGVDAIRGHREISSANRLVALLAGFGIGVGLGVLFAPRSGGETRDIIRDRAADISDTARERYGRVRDTVTSRVPASRSDAGEGTETR